MKKHFVILISLLLVLHVSAQTDSIPQVSSTWLKINYGGGISDRQLIASSVAKNQKESLDTLEKPAYAQLLTLAVNKKIANYLFCSVGLRFGKLSERTNNSDITPQINYINNKYRLAVPVTLILKKDFSKSSIYCSAGAEFSYILFSKYKTIVNNSKLDYKAAIEGTYRKANLASELSLGYQVPLSANCKFDISAQYIRFLSSLTQGPIKKYPYTVTLNIGLSFSLK